MTLPLPTVLIVDDESDIREVLALSLKDVGYGVQTAADGHEALEICRQGGIRIIVTDIRMPRMDGLRLLEAVKRLDPDIEVIVVTAFGDIETAILALRGDASDFITKPIHHEALHLALRRATERLATRRRLAEQNAFLKRENARSLEELERTFSFQRNLIESSMDGILGCATDGTVHLCNPSLLRLLGYPREAVVGRLRLEDFIAPEARAGFQAALDGGRHGGSGRLFRYETRLIDADGHAIPVQVSAFRLADPQREQGLVCFVHDLRQVRRLEHEVAEQAKILHQDKMMSLGHLAASVVHEINNPLAGILTYARLMQKVLDRGELTGAQQEKFRQYLAMVEGESARCSRIVSSLLAFSRKSPANFASVEVAGLVESCIALTGHKLKLAGVQVSLQVDPGLPPVRGDVNQLKQCLINLIFNALDAMAAGGRLTIGARRAGERRIEIAVSDTGAGIAPEHQARIFEPFFTTKQEGYGTGLGLSTVYGIMRRHGGSVRFESQAGRGTTFVLDLPEG
ncbi:MAG TPA: response regulator [Desulfobacteraceae bacterium]|nr:response regulator [Deltaproteobacteria bacterium]MBW2355650.1 response regulator [Deltaproteobacteria bacterium]HDI59938.1 response regulator [Desulfobacteraceae bacterium]